MRKQAHNLFPHELEASSLAKSQGGEVHQFDYIVATQKDELINEDDLAVAYLQMYENLGLISQNSKSIQDNIQNQDYEQSQISQSLLDEINNLDVVFPELPDNNRASDSQEKWDEEISKGWEPGND